MWSAAVIFSLCAAVLLHELKQRRLRVALWVGNYECLMAAYLINIILGKNKYTLGERWSAAERSP
jgi:hypothetical protein